MPYDDPDLDFSSVAAKPALNYEGLLRNEATRQGVDPEHIVSLSRAESSLNPSARSPKGAVGLMQVMPATGRRYGIKPLMLADPATNARVGVSEYKRLLGKYNDPKLAVAAYNAGEGAVDSANGVPRFQETKNHVKKVIGGAKYSDPDLDFTHAGGDPDLDFSGTVKPVPVKPSKLAFAWNAGSTPTVSSVRPVHQPARLAAQADSSGDAPHIAESYNPTPPPQLGRNFTETVSPPQRMRSRPFSVDAQARGANVGERPRVLPGDDTELVPAGSVFHPTSIADIEAQGRAINRGYRNQAMEQEGANTDARHGAVVNTLRHLGSNVLAGAGETASGVVGGVARLLPGRAAANVARTAKELQETASDVRARQGQGVANDLAYEAGALAPQMVSGGPVGFGVTSALNAAGHGATLPESIKQGVSAAATAKLGGVMANRLQRPLARAPEAYMERAAGNVMAPVITRAATGGGLDVTPSDIIFGGAFGLHGGSEQSARREAAEGKAPTKTYPAQYGSARETYETSRAAQEREPVTSPVIVKPTEASAESALQAGIGARQPLQSPRLVKRISMPAQDIKQAASPVEQTPSPIVFHSETGPVGHDEMVSTLDDLLSLIPERATRQRIIDESVAEGGASYENVVRAAFRKAEEATSGKGGNDTPEPPSDTEMEGKGGQRNAGIRNARRVLSGTAERGTPVDLSVDQATTPDRTTASSTSPAKGLTRNFRAGNNDATMTFADDAHRDLYDLGAKMRYLGRGGQNKASQRAIGDIAGLRKSLAERLNVPQADIGRMAMDTLDDVKAQMKGVKHGEGRQLINNVKPPTPTVTTIKNSAPQNRAVNPESDSLLAAIQKIGFDSTTPEGSDLARYLSTREGGRPGMVNNQRLNGGERRGVDNHLIRSLQEAGFDIKDSNDLMDKVRQEQGGKPVYSTAYDHAAQAARELKPYLEANHSPEIAQTVNTLAEAINNHSEFGQLSDKIAHGEATDAEIKRFGEVGRYELNIDPDAIQSFIETHENAQQSQRRGAELGIEAGQQAVSGAERTAGEQEGDVNDTQRVATQKSGNGQFPARSDNRDVREYSAGRGRTKTLLPENSGGLRRTAPVRPDYIHDTLDRLTEQARATKRSLSDLVDEHIAQAPLPGQESTAFTPDEARMARSLAMSYDAKTRRAPVKEQAQSLLDTTPTAESRQTAQKQAESQQGEGLANSPLFNNRKSSSLTKDYFDEQGFENINAARMKNRVSPFTREEYNPEYFAKQLVQSVAEARSAEKSANSPMFESVKVEEPPHHSELQPRTPEGRFDGPPTTPEYVKPSSVETVHQSELQGALQLKTDAWKKVKELRTRIANEPLGGNRSGLRLQLMNWQDAHGKAIELERQARQAIEGRANELKQTTVKPKPAPDFALQEPKAEPAKGEHGQFINALFKSPDADNQVPSFLANPEVRAKLGLPRTGKPAETKDTLAEAMGLPRSSHISPEALRAWASENGLGQDALSAIDSAHAQYRARLRAKELGGRDDDPDIITQYRNDLGKKSGDLSGTLLSDPERGYKAVTVLGYDLYQTAKNFGNWSRQMVGRLGERVRPMLRDLWNGIKNSDFITNERGSLRFGKGENTTTEPVTNKRLEQIFKANKGEGDMPPPRRRFKQEALDDLFKTDEKVTVEAAHQTMQDAWDDFTEPREPAKANAARAGEAYYEQGKKAPDKLLSFRTLDSWMKANMLQGMSPYSHKVGSLASNALAEAASTPGAAAADWVISKAKGGRRSVVVDPKGMGKAAASAVTTGAREAMQIMRQGATQKQIEQYGMPNQLNTRSPIVNAMVNYTFRTYKAGAHIFGTMAYQKALSNQAKAWALNEVTAGKIRGNEVSKRTQEILNGSDIPEGVTATMEGNATLAYADAVFQSENKLNDVRKKIIGNGNGAWAFAVNRVVPFMKSASNAYLKMLDYTGVGPKGAIAETGRAIQRKSNSGQAIRTLEDQRAAATAWGKLPVGLGLFTAGIILHRNGLMTSLTYQHDDNPQPGSVRAFGKLIDVARYSPIGLIMAAGATFDELSHDKDNDALTAAVKVVAKSASNLPMFSQTTDLVKTAQALAEGKTSVPGIGGAIGKSLLTRTAPTMIPAYATVRDVKGGIEQSDKYVAGPVGKMMHVQNQLTEPRSADEVKIHEADRAAHPLPPMSDLKKTEVDAKGEITRAMQSHDKNTPAIIQKHIASGAIKPDDVYDIADKASKSDEQRMIEGFKRLPLEEMANQYVKLSPAGRAKVRQEFQEAAIDQFPNLTPLQQKTLGPKIGQALRAQ